MSWNVILWACTWTQRRGRFFPKKPVGIAADCCVVMSRVETKKEEIHGAFFGGNLVVKYVKSVVRVDVFFFWNFFDFPHFSRTKLGCTSPKQQDMPRDIYQPQFCSLRSPKLHVQKNQSTQDMKIFRGGAWIIYIYFWLLLYHKFGSVYLISHKRETNLWGQNLGETWRCKGEEGTGG